MEVPCRRFCSKSVISMRKKMHCCGNRSHESIYFVRSLWPSESKTFGIRTNKVEWITFISIHYNMTIASNTHQSIELRMRTCVFMFIVRHADSLGYLSTLLFNGCQFFSSCSTVVAFELWQFDQSDKKSNHQQPNKMAWKKRITIIGIVVLLNLEPFGLQSTLVCVVMPKHRRFSMFPFISCISTPKEKKINTVAWRAFFVVVFTHLFIKLY